ncbi:MAG: radical SAM protein [Bryobacteraceae bacterium]
MLFADWQSEQLVGIARLAARGELIEAKRRVSYRELPARSLLSRCPNPRLPFRWTINPYRGCEFGCKYCYARYTHEFMELRESRDFEEKIFVKQWSAAGFRQELRRIDPAEPIAIGTATDPYQPAERRYRITRRILEVFAGERGRSLGITTKSDLVSRDADLLQRVARGNSLSVNLTITTLDARLARRIEPFAPRPDLRLAAIRKLAGAGIRAGVFVAPVLPLINDSAESLEAIARAARDAGARHFGGNVLFLKPCASKVFLPFLEEEFPQLIRRYRERYEQSAYLRGAYPALIRERIKAARDRAGLAPRMESGELPPEPSNVQLRLIV